MQETSVDPIRIIYNQNWLNKIASYLAFDVNNQIASLQRMLRLLLLRRTMATLPALGKIVRYIFFKRNNENKLKKLLNAIIGSKKSKQTTWLAITEKQLIKQLGKLLKMSTLERIWLLELQK